MRATVAVKVTASDGVGSGSDTFNITVTGTELVSNTDQSSTSATSNFVAQSFTTGPASAAVTDIQLRVTSTTGTVSVKLRDDNSGVPGNLVATFTSPSSFTQNALNTFTAPANTVLAANTTYWVSVSEGESSRRNVSFANDGNENSAAGWTIGDLGKFRLSESNSWSDLSQPLLMAINGGLSPAAAVDGTTLTITFDKDLDTTSVPDFGKFHVVSGGDDVGTTRVVIAGGTVTLGLSRTVGPGESLVRVSYVKPSSSPLRYSDGTEVASFAGLAVTNSAGEGTATVASVAVVSKPRNGSPVKDTYGRGQQIVVDVTWDREVAWDTSATNADVQVSLTVGSNTRTASLVKGGATSGTARTLRFRYTVVTADSDTDGIEVAASGGNVVALANGATLKNAKGTADASRAHGGLAAGSGHKVDGSSAATANSGPTFDDGDPNTMNDKDLGTQQAPYGTLVGTRLEHFADANGDPLTYTVSVDRGDIRQNGFPVIRFLLGDPWVYFESRSHCAVENLSPTPTNPVDTTVTVTASDPDGASVSVTVKYRLSRSCPSLSSAAVSGRTVTLTLDAAAKVPGYAPAGEAPAAGEFTVKVGGTAVTVADDDPEVDGETITLRLAQPVAAGDTVTVSYAPGDFPVAVAFADQAAVNNTADVPTVSSAVVEDGPDDDDGPGDGRVIKLTFSEDLAEPSAELQYQMRYGFVIFGIVYRGAPITNAGPNKVEISGPTVKLTMGIPVQQGGEITVGYTPVGPTRLEDLDGNPVEDFTVSASRSGQWQPLLIDALMEDRVLALLFDQALDESSAPAGRRFYVSHNSVQLDGTGTAAVSDNRVTVTLSGAPSTVQDAIKVYYFKGTGADEDPKPLRAASTALRNRNVGSIEAAFADRLASAVPVFSSGSVAGTKAVLYYSEMLDPGSEPATSDFSVTVGGSAATVSSVSVEGSAVVLTLSSSVTSGQSVTVSYTKGTNPIQDLIGKDAANLSSETLTNRGPTDTGAPASSSATSASSATDDTRLVTITFDKDLDPAEMPAPSAFTMSLVWKSVKRVAVRGSTVELSLTEPIYPCTRPFSVSYAKPDSGALANLWGTDAAAFDDLTVTNPPHEQLRERSEPGAAGQRHPHRGAAVCHRCAA